MFPHKNAAHLNIMQQQGGQTAPERQYVKGAFSCACGCNATGAKYSVSLDTHQLHYIF